MQHPQKYEIHAKFPFLKHWLYYGFHILNFAQMTFVTPQNTRDLFDLNMGHPESKEENYQTVSPL